VWGTGVILSYYRPKTTNASLWQATDELTSQLRSTDPACRAGQDLPRETRVGGKDAILTALNSNSIFQGQTELDRLITVSHPNGILYLCSLRQTASGNSGPSFRPDAQVDPVQFLNAARPAVPDSVGRSSHGDGRPGSKNGRTSSSERRREL